MTKFKHLICEGAKISSQVKDDLGSFEIQFVGNMIFLGFSKVQLTKIENKLKGGQKRIVVMRILGE